MRKAINIIWDVESDSDLDFLPTEINIPDNIPKKDISDYISDITGFCHKGFTLSTESTDCNMVLLEIVDPSVDVGEDSLMERYLLANPSKEKLDELEHLLSTAYDEDGEWYERIPLEEADKFIQKNFTVVPMRLCTLKY